MKKTILVLCAISAFMVAQDAAGQYKLTGVDVLYTFVTRATNTLTVTDDYGLGITQAIATIPANVPFTTQAMQLSDAALSGVGINLNVTLNDDGSGSIAEGSYYPDVNTIVDENGNCVTLQQVLPVTDTFTYESSNSGMSDYGLYHPGVNVLGIPGISPNAGQQLGLLGLSGSNTFEDYPMVPSHPTLCGPDAGDCVDFTVGDSDESGTLEIYPNLNTQGIPEYVPGGYPLTGITGGFFLDDQCNDDGTGCNATDLTSVFPGNTDPDFLLEWHGVDGVSSGLGCGDEDDCLNDVLTDEDADGSYFDRTIGIPAVTATFMNPACGFNQPIFGDVTATFEAQGLGSCVDNVDEAASGYLMDASLAQWGGFLTGNALAYSQTAASLTNTDPNAGDVDPAGIMAGCGAFLAVNGTMPDDVTCFSAAGAFYASGGAAPSDDDVLECMADGNDAADCITAGVTACVTDCATAAVGAYVYANNAAILADDGGSDFNGTTGRLTMNFDIPCVGIVEAREVIAEFIEVGQDECGSGDVTGAENGGGDGAWNVLDIVALVNCVLANSCEDCAGDTNGDGGFNVLDVVALVNCVLAQNCDGSGRIDSATSAEFNVIGNEVTMTADGLVGGVQMTLSHGGDFALKLTDGGQYSDYYTEGNTTAIVIVNPVNENLFTANGDFTIESVIVSDLTGSSELSASVNMPSNFSLSAAYPNPFNPTTQMNLALHTKADVSVKVFNMSGKLVDVIAEGQMDRGSYSLTWDGTSASSGVYFVKTEVGSVVQNQKIMLIK